MNQLAVVLIIIIKKILLYLNSEAHQNKGVRQSLKSLYNVSYQY